MRAVILLALLPLGACGFHRDSGPGAPASGSGSSRSFALTDFTGVSLLGSDDVDVRVGSGFSVRADGPSAELDKLRIVRDGNTLKVGRLDSSGFSWGDHEKVTVHVTMPRIIAAETAGSGDITIDRAEGQSFAATILGSGNIDVAALSAQATNLVVRGSGDVTAKGKAGALDATVAGSGGIDGAGLTATSATVSVAGSGDVRAEVDGTAKVSVLGSGDVALGKSARCTISKIGSGDVTCG